MSDLGYWILFITLPIWVYGLTGNVIDLSIMFSVQLIPSLVINLFGGAVIDEFNRKKIIIFLNILTGLVLLPLTSLNIGGSLKLIYFIIFIKAILSQLSELSEKALLPELTSKKSLVKVNSILSTTESIIFFIGPLIGTVLVNLTNPQFLITIDAFIYFCSGIILLFMKKYHMREENVTIKNLLENIIEGFNTVVQNKNMIWFFIISGIFMIGQGLINVLGNVVFVEELLNQSFYFFGLLISSQALGEIIGGFIIIKKEKIKSKKLLSTGLIITGLLLALTYSLTNFFFAIITTIFSGIFFSAVYIGKISYLQNKVDNKFIGRVISLNKSTNSLITLVSTSSAWFISNMIGNQTTLIIAGLTYTLAGITCLKLIKE